MSTNTSIEWATKTWGPVLGCKKVSAGCDNCYAIRTGHRLASNPNPKVSDAYAGLTEWTEQGLDWTGVVRTLPERLGDPMKWRKPERIFVNSQSDLFHPAVGADFTARVFATMASTPQHTYQILTKRPDIAAKLLSDGLFLLRAWEYANRELPERMIDAWPLRNVWIGVSVEDQATADDRIPKLMTIPAAVRWISAEPLLAPINLIRTLGLQVEQHLNAAGDVETATGPWLDWVVVGGESGPGARPMHPDWARSLRDQCAAAGVPMLFKQWGQYRWIAGTRWDEPTQCWVDHGIVPQRVGKKLAGRELDGVTHDAYPQAVPA